MEGDDAAPHTARLRELRADPVGNLWVSAYEPTDRPPARWTVFGPAGRIVASVAAPPRFRVYDIGTDWILGVWRDELGIEYVRLHPLERSSGT